ncbi:VOC family protein [Proteiniclasticum sp. QWL-01]|uniref:VOC family protein n=1 Tax=Proteiniclasticum sp. QWL-01 TaxID=3036945 RepID=UPI00220A358E|nr:VOC family protein [Proteiniclasticum sp. QWL-01]UUM12310.1 hypothetical protein NQU17_01780 [Clostridiaceae bacterium HFYG-1003]WFF73842.1 hypothetical protein P6M73_05190 [Proteiniclasticum sp. QWL-01]
MNIERLDRICIAVPNLEEGKQRFGKLLGIRFEFSGEVTMPDGKIVHMALSNQGIELLEVPDREVHVRSFHFKVNDLEEAVQQVRDRNVDVLGEFRVGDMKEAILDLMGLRALLIEYPGTDPALAAKGEAKV